MSQTTETTTTDVKATVKGVKTAPKKTVKGVAPKATEAKGKTPPKAAPKAEKVPAKKTEAKEFVKPDHLRKPQVRILEILAKNPAGMTRTDISQTLQITNEGTNLSEMIGSVGGEPNKYTTTLIERKMVKYSVQEEGTLVVITAAGQAALKAQAKAAK